MTGSNGSDGQSGFSPEMVATINRAYEEATIRLDIQHAHSDRRAVLARCIMDLAKAGETSEQALLDRAMAEVKRTEAVRERAHQIWESEGRPTGLEDQHWRRAETELGAVGGA